MAVDAGPVPAIADDARAYDAVNAGQLCVGIDFAHQEGLARGRPVDETVAGLEGTVDALFQFKIRLGLVGAPAVPPGADRLRRRRFDLP